MKVDKARHAWPTRRDTWCGLHHDDNADTECLQPFHWSSIERRGRAVLERFPKHDGVVGNDIEETLIRIHSDVGGRRLGTWIILRIEAMFNIQWFNDEEFKSPRKVTRQINNKPDGFLIWILHIREILADPNNQSATHPSHTSRTKTQWIHAMCDRKASIAFCAAIQKIDVPRLAQWGR